MKNTLLTLALLACASFAFGQTTSASAAAADPIFEQVDQAAAFPGGQAAMDKFVVANQRSLETKRSAVQSTDVVLKIVVEKDGRVSRTVAVSAPNVQLEEEAVVLVHKMGNWKPAQVGGQAVRSYVTVPVHLSLN